MPLAAAVFALAQGVGPVQVLSMNDKDFAPPSETGSFSVDFPRAHGSPPGEAVMRRECADFQVDEDLGHHPEGQGEHLYLLVRKTNQNTRWVAGLLATAFAVDPLQVGYSGLKDRRAVTTQWFSVPVPMGSGMPPLPTLEGCEILAAGRHPRKLRQGSHRGNRFAIRLREFRGDDATLEQRLRAVQSLGVPNYFGEQRFGIDAGNLREVERMIATGSPRFKGSRGGLYLSAARSWLFNQVLAARVLDGTWLEDGADGPLWGRGRNPAVESDAKREASLLAPWQAWCHALEHSGLRQERRPLRLLPGDLCWRREGDDVLLDFSLPPGCYATALLREVAVLSVPGPMV